MDAASVELAKVPPADHRDRCQPVGKRTVAELARDIPAQQ
jgi:hypothetical protein